MGTSRGIFDILCLPRGVSSQRYTRPVKTPQVHHRRRQSLRTTVDTFGPLHHSFTSNMKFTAVFATAILAATAYGAAVPEANT
jgi:hypothetical protein